MTNTLAETSSTTALAEPVSSTSVSTTTAVDPVPTPAPAPAAAAPLAPAPVAATSALETAIQKPHTPTKSVRIHINLKDQPRPVVFNYRQLYKRELKKIEALQDVDVPMPSAVDSADDLFYQELLKKAESYAMDDDDADDDGSDEEIGLHKKAVGNEYDFEDPFIDDSEMLLDEPQEYSAPEFDGFFVYHGPLDGHDGAEKKTTTPKRKTPAKAKATTTATSAGANGITNATTTTTNATSATTSTKKAGPSNQHTATPGANDGKSRNKKTVDHDGDTSSQKSKKSANATAAAAAAATGISGSAKSTTTTSKQTASSSVAKKPSATLDQPAKKKKKLDPKDKREVETNKTAVAATASLASTSSSVSPVDSASSKKKKTVSPTSLKPLDPEVEVLMEKLRQDVKLERFENKAKFPLSLKPTVLEIGLITFRKYKTVDDNLVYHLMAILPYNRFTLKKFLTTKSGQMRVDELQQEIDELAIQLKQTIDRMMPEQQRLFNEKKAQAQASSSEAFNAEEEPTPKFKCNDEVRKILYDIIQTEEQSIHIANQVALHKDSEKKPEGLASDNKARKLMYQRLLSCWPEGWMHSYEMSRQYSQYKSKISASSEKKAAANATNENKKRKRATPQSSPSDEGNRKRQSITQDVLPPDASNFQNQINKAKQTTSVITIDTDDENDDEASSIWKQPSSMKIESLISNGGHRIAATEKED